MELRHLRYFVAVADELHFGRAAKRLQMSQPPLSQQIQNLEHELGAELFRRTKRDVQLTSAGKAFLERARQLLLEVERAAEAARQAARGVIGRLEIGYVTTAEVRVIPRVLRVLRRRFPEVEVGLHLLSPLEQVEALRQSRIDIALTWLPLDEPGIVAERFLREDLILAVGSRSALARGGPVRPEQLQGTPVLMFPRHVAPAMHDLILGYFRKSGVSPRLIYGISSIVGSLGLISSGMGLSLIPEAVQDIHFGGVAYRRLAGVAPRTDLAVARLAESPTPLQEYFLKLIRELYPRTPRGPSRRRS